MTIDSGIVRMDGIMGSHEKRLFFETSREHVVSDPPDWDALRRMPLSGWEPRSQLPARSRSTPRSAVPSVDAHNHLGRWLNDGQWMFEDVDALINELDASNIELLIHMDGFWGEELDARERKRVGGGKGVDRGGRSNIRKKKTADKLKPDS